MRTLRRRGRAPRRTAAACALVLLAVAGCSDPGPDADGGSSGSASRDAAGEEAAPPSPAERLGLTTGWGPSEAELDRAAREVRKLPLPALAGQLIVAEWRGTAPPVALVRDLHLGGVIAFESNVVSAEQVRGVNRTLTQQARRPWPLFLTVDQEGGVVERMRGVATRFPAFMSAGAAGDVDLTRAAYRASGAELRNLGFTADLAPDADVTSGPGDPTIGSRAASSDARMVADHVVAAAEGFTASGVLPVVKHFPGHGSVPADSHVTLPVQTRTRAELDAVELVPFRAAVDQGLPAVMIGHLDVQAVDPGVPSSLSRPVVTGLLREELGFEGLVVTDSLSMAGVTRARQPDRIVLDALRAGADVLLMPASPASARAALVRAVRSGTVPRRRLEQSAARQVALLRHLARAPRGAAPAIGSAAPASRRLSAAALTLVQGPCGERHVADAVHPYGDPVAVAAFSAAARASGLTVLARQAPPVALARAIERPGRGRREKPKAYQARLRDWQRAEAVRKRRLAAWQASEDARLAAGTAVGLSGFRDAPVDGQVAVATDTPWVLGQVSAPVRVATYGDTPAAMGALVDVLLGRAEAPGRLPVRVDGVARRGC